MSSLTCCQTADDEALEHDAELFNCEACPYHEKRESLSEANRVALETFGLLARRIVVDFQLAPLVFEALTIKVSRERARLLVESLDLIYSIRCPPPKAHG